MHKFTISLKNIPFQIYIYIYIYIKKKKKKDETKLSKENRLTNLIEKGGGERVKLQEQSIKQ